MYSKDMILEMAHKIVNKIINKQLNTIQKQRIKEIQKLNTI